eukprot:403345224
MGNTCCSNEDRKADKQKSQGADLQSYFIQEAVNGGNGLIRNSVARRNEDGYFSHIGMIHSNNTSSNSLIDMESRFTMSRIMNRNDLQNQQDVQKYQKTRKYGNKTNKSHKRDKQEVFDNFQGDLYSSQKQLIIIKTLQLLVSECQRTRVHVENVQRYDFTEIRKYLKISNYNHQIAARKILTNIVWRNKLLPIRFGDLLALINSQKVLLQGIDKDLCPIVYFKPNFDAHSHKNVSNNNSEQKRDKFIGAKHYMMYLTNIMDQILPIMHLQGGITNKLTILIDLQNEEFRLDLFELIEDLALNHFPDRLNKVFVININIQTITQQVQQKFQQKFFKKNILLFDENYKVNLLKFIDRDELREENGGNVENIERAKNCSFRGIEDVQDFILSAFEIQV